MPVVELLNGAKGVKKIVIEDENQNPELEEILSR
jgi:hypothetical protein